jgi:hypothetical protein
MRVMKPLVAWPTASNASSGSRPLWTLRAEWSCPRQG